ncbi:VWA domain-containing protein [Deinococcus marmoris]|uniref:VWA domain-containing protein n=1 Tax=Deinococcus marmoris TaxID=249408 RepID=A0A1U7NTI8_9DEIO|nr:VWA domain-containing protein [Deinococcus marmoris]OLV16217.1 hypothetical protein BOO71_0012499 [Deinococcus marmoris]
MPQPDPGSAAIIAEDVEGHARRLAPLLKPPERPGRTRPHRSKGRYDARRDARDAERVFVRKTVASRPMPIRVRLLIDISISMGGEPIRCARAAAGMVVRAAALSGSSAEVHLFNTRHQAVITGPMPYLTAQALIAGIEVGGSTCLSPALAVLSDSPAHPLEKELIVITPFRA